MVEVQLPHCVSVGVRRFDAVHGPEDLTVYELQFPSWPGAQPRKNWRKPVVGPPDRPFAELRIVESLEDQGWSAGWVYRPGKFLATWEPRRPATLADEAIELHSRITRRVARSGGCWDVFGWREGRPLFLEVKRAGSSDRIRGSQWDWQVAARAEGVAPSSFAVAEWTVGDAS